MERLTLKFKDANKSLKTLNSIKKEPFTIIVRDATIQRFEYTFEAFWKFLKEYLKEKEGMVANSPKAVFKEIFSLGLCTERQAKRLLNMTDKRNETSHTYKDKIAQMIYGKIIKDFLPLMSDLLSKLKI
jgi:nucleotidyltransferase substrate binding protein (TIGR01987 family)